MKQTDQCAVVKMMSNLNSSAGVKFSKSQSDFSLVLDKTTAHQVEENSPVQYSGNIDSLTNKHLAVIADMGNRVAAHALQVASVGPVETSRPCHK